MAAADIGMPQRPALRLRGQPAGTGRRSRAHALPRLPRAARRAIRLFHQELPTDAGGGMSGLRHRDPGPLGRALRRTDHGSAVPARLEAAADALSRNGADLSERSAVSWRCLLLSSVSSSAVLKTLNGCAPSTTLVTLIGSPPRRRPADEERGRAADARASGSARRSPSLPSSACRSRGRRGVRCASRPDRLPPPARAARSSAAASRTASRGAPRTCPGRRRSLPLRAIGTHRGAAARSDSAGTRAGPCRS